MIFAVYLYWDRLQHLFVFALYFSVDLFHLCVVFGHLPVCGTSTSTSTSTSAYRYRQPALQHIMMLLTEKIIKTFLFTHPFICSVLHDKFLTLTRRWHKFSAAGLESVFCLSINLPNHQERRELVQDGWHVSQTPHGELNHCSAQTNCTKAEDTTKASRGGTAPPHSTGRAWRRPASLLPYHLSSLNYTGQSDKSILMRGLLP